VSARGERKLMGVGQRVVAGGVHVGGVIVVAGGDRVNAILTPVYAALGLSWRPQATGAVADEVPGIGWEAVTEALLAEYDDRHGLEEVALDDETLELARKLAPEHLAPPTP
jgi:hypothetical protein